MQSGPAAYNKVAIKALIDAYEVLNPDGPDSIVMSILDAKQEREEQVKAGVVSKFGIVRGNTAGRRQKYVMPSNLYIEIRKKFPSAFSKDVDKFERDFPVFFRAWR